LNSEEREEGRRVKVGGVKRYRFLAEGADFDTVKM